MSDGIKDIELRRLVGYDGVRYLCAAEIYFGCWGAFKIGAGVNDGMHEILIECFREVRSEMHIYSGYLTGT